MSQPKIEFYKLRDFGAKMNATVDFLRENFGRLSLNLLFIGGPFALILGLIFTNFFSSFTDLMGLAEDPDVSRIGAVVGGSYFLMYIVVWLALSMIISVTYTYIRLYNEGVAKDTPVGDVLKLSLKKLGGVLLLSFMVYLTSFIGFILFFIPGIFLFVTLSLSFPIYFFEEGIHPLDAYSRSFKLIKSKWFSTLGILIVTALMGYFISMVFTIPFFAVYAIELFTLFGDLQNNPNPDDPTAVFNIFTSWYMTGAMAIMMIGSLITGCIPYIGIAYQYSNLVERTEGRGLMQEIEDFDKADH